MSIFQRQHDAASAFHWQLLHLAPGSDPGLYKAWVLLGSDLYAVPLRIPRSFYVNAALVPEDAQAIGLHQRVCKALPYRQVAANVYAVLPAAGPSCGLAVDAPPPQIHRVSVLPRICVRPVTCSGLLPQPPFLCCNGLRAP